MPLDKGPLRLLALTRIDLAYCTSGPVFSGSDRFKQPLSPASKLRGRKNPLSLPLSRSFRLRFCLSPGRALELDQILQRHQSTPKSLHRSRKRDRAFILGENCRGKDVLFQLQEGTASRIRRLLQPPGHVSASSLTTECHCHSPN